MIRSKKKRVHNTSNIPEEDNYDTPKKWYEEIISDPKKFSKCTEQVLIELKEEAKKCNDTEVANYNIKKSRTNSDYQWMKTVMSKGTVSDKIAAHTVLIQENPVCNLEHIRNLVGMVKVGKKKECISVISTLVEVFLSDLLRPDQKLRAFHQRPLSLLNDLSSGNAVTRRKFLSCWYFEDQLKEIYTSFVLALNTVAHDTVDSNKEKAITAMYKLLSGNPEQEKNLLSYIINKLGDPSQKVASKVIYCLTQLLHKHVNMQGVVLNEIEKLLFRPNISNRAQYYSLCFLSQFYLSHETGEVARKLIETYFAFFKACVKKGDVDSRMMSALLMGINRAYPYAEIEFSKISEHIDTMYRLVHMASFNTGLQALILLFQVCGAEQHNIQRFYSAFYRKLLDPSLLLTKHKAMLLSLIYKALLKDTETSRVRMFVKRILQISLNAEPSFACGILYLISQVINKKPDVLALISKQYLMGNLDDDDTEEKYFDVKDETADFENVEIKTETVDETVVAESEEIKLEHEDDIEIKEEPLQEQNESIPASNTTTIEIKDEEEDVKPDVEVLDESLKQPGSWHHRQIIPPPRSMSYYRPFARNPLFGGGEFCSYTELIYLQNHFHPTVALYASNILKGEVINYSGDPLNDFTLIRFLERFVFKNPKKIEETAGKNPTFAQRKLQRPKGVKLMSVKSSGYLNEDSKNIPVDELFLHSYLQKRYQDKTLDENDDSDLESVQSEEFEEMLDKMSGFKNTVNDIDFMDEIGDSLKKKDVKKGETAGSEESEDGLSDEEENFDDDMDENDEELIGGLDDDDEEEMEFLDDSDPQKDAKKKFKKKKNDISSLFASAEEFATLLEDEGGSKVKPGGSNIFSNIDNAHVKQLNWEENRNRWIKGFDRAVTGKKGKKFRTDSKEFSKKRPNRDKFANKNKKFKK